MENKYLIIIIAVSFIFYFIGKNDGDLNKKLIYGDTGLPKNCRAIITSNINGYMAGEFTADGALDSINRNCGEYGYSWGR